VLLSLTLCVFVSCFSPQLKLAGAYCFWASHVGFSVVCPWFCLSVGLSHKMVQFASNKDQNVPRCCPATFWSRSRSRMQNAETPQQCSSAVPLLPLCFLKVEWSRTLICQNGFLAVTPQHMAWYTSGTGHSFLILVRMLLCLALHVFLFFSCFSSTVLSAVCWVRGGQYPACRQACSGNNQRFHLGKSGLTWSSRSTHVICCHVTIFSEADDSSV